MGAKIGDVPSAFYPILHYPAQGGAGCVYKECTHQRIRSPYTGELVEFSRRNGPYSVVDTQPKTVPTGLC
jgi:hypothetical protein